MWFKKMRRPLNGESLSIKFILNVSRFVLKSKLGNSAVGVSEG